VKVVVVGGGIVGTAAAYFLAQQGDEVTLLEAETLGYGASGRNPGFVWLHLRNPGFALEIARAGRDLYQLLAAELPIDFELRSSGGLIFFTSDDQARIAQEFVEARTGAGLPMEMLDGSDVRQIVPPVRPDVVCGTYCPLDAHINTGLLVKSLAAGAQQLGAKVLEHHTVTRLGLDGDRVVGVETAAGRFEADEVVVAAGVWSPQLLGAVGVTVPIGGERLQIMGTDPMPDVHIEPVVYGPSAAKQYSLFRQLPSWDERHFREDYEDEAGLEMLELLAQRRDGRILLGCAMDYPQNMAMHPTLEGILAMTAATSVDFPGLRTAPIERVWAGLLPYTPDTLPVIDRAGPGVIVAGGHVYGNAAGPMTGKLVAEMVAGQPTSIDLGECRLDRDVSLAPSGVATRW